MSTEIATLVAELPSLADIVPNPNVPLYPGATTTHDVDHDNIKTILGLLNDQSSSSAGGVGVPLSRHGVKKDSSTDNTDAVNACIADAIDEGSFIVFDDVLPDNNGDRMMLDGRVDFFNCFFDGMAIVGSIFEATDHDAGVDWNAYGNPVLYGGGGRRFSVYGGPFGSPGIANRPMTVGLLTMPYFVGFRAWNALSGADGVCLLLAATQNGKFDLAWPGGGDVALRFDAGASANAFHKYEISAAAKNIVEYRASLTSPPGQQAYTVYNQLGAEGIIEAPLSTTEHMVYSAAGALNTIQGTISVNATAFGGTNPAGMADIVHVEAAESTQASMVLNNVKMNGGSVAGICGVNSVVTGAFGAARVHMQDGSMGAMALGGKGIIMIGHPTPWFFSSVTQKWDTSLITTLIPHFERSAREFFKADGGVGDVLVVSQVTGETNVRFFDRADGTRVYGDGTNSTDGSFGRLGSDSGLGIVGNVSGWLGAKSAAYNGAHFMMGARHLWYNANGVLYGKSSVPTSANDGYPVAAFLDSAAWNGAHPIWGTFQLWVDGSGRLRIKNGTPTSDTDGTVVGTQT